MEIYRNPENLGWAACMNIDVNEKAILLVRNLKREFQILDELKKQGYDSEEDQKRYWRKIIWQLSQKRILEKPSKWELTGGKISWWQGNPELRTEFQALLKTKESEVAQKEFLSKIGMRILNNDKLLEQAAAGTADDEFVQESGLVVGEKIFLTRANDPDRNDPKNHDLFYPRFWYLATSIQDGELRTEPIKKTISAPQWVPIMKLHPYLNNQGYFPFHRAHCLGVVAAAKYFIKQGRTEFSEVVSYLEKTFGAQKEIEVFKDADWDSLTQTVQKLN